MNTVEPRRGPGRPRKDGLPPQSKTAGEPPRQLTRWEVEQAREQEELARREMAREAAARELARLDAMKDKLTASQHLARLQAARDAGGGYLIVPPSGLQHAQLVEPQDSEGRLAGHLVRNDHMKRALAHMKAVAEIGAPSDLQLFWETWQPLQSGAVNPKQNLLPEYQQLAAVAGQRHEALVRRADEEQRPMRVVAELRRNLAIAEQRLELERKRYLGPAEAEVARCKALLAQAEKAAA